MKMEGMIFMAYARKRPTGWQGVANYKLDGKRKTKVKSGFKLKREALQWANNEEVQLANGYGLSNADISFADYYWLWFKTYREPGLSQNTKEGYQTRRHLIQKYFGDTKIKDIKRSDYQKFINQYGSHRSPSSVSKLAGTIKACVQSAMYDGVVKKDFTFNVKRTANKERIRKVEYLSNAEIKRLKDVLVKARKPTHPSKYMILTALYTGMRKGEIQALTWKDIDFMHQTIDINKAWNDRNKNFKSTKTEASNRTIKVNRQLLNWLSELKVNQSTMVFKSPLTQDVPIGASLSEVLKNALNKADIHKKNFHFHSLRHVHVAYLLSHGVDIYVISKRLGHANVSVTQNIYSYLLDEYQHASDDLILEKLSEI